MANPAVCLLLASLLFLTGGCTAQGTSRFSEPSPGLGEALVYVYRLPGPAGRLVGAGFFVDDHGSVIHARNVVLRQFEYSSFRLSPGTHTFLMHGTFPAASSVALEVDVAAGETAYVRLSSDAADWKLEEVAPAVGRPEIAACRYRSPARLPAEAPGAAPH